MRLVCTLLLFTLVATPVVGAEIATLLRDIGIDPDARDRASSNPEGFTRVGGRMLLVSETSFGFDGLWSTDGTPAGTELLLPDLRDVTLGPIERGVMAFWTREEDLTTRIWRTDGTRSGTWPLTPLAGSGLGFGSEAVWIGGRLLFRGGDGDTGSELWVSDGQPEDAALLVDLLPGVLSSSPSDFLHFRGALYFHADGALHRTDGTAAGTERLVEGVRGRLVAAGDRLYWQRGTGSYQIWTSDGTPAGTRLLLSFFDDDLGNFHDWLLPVGNRVYFVAVDDANGHEIWVTDGTVAGTRPATAFEEPNRFHNLTEQQVVAFEGRAYFMAFDRPVVGLYSTAGDPASVRRVFDVHNVQDLGSEAAGSEIIRIGDRLMTVAARRGGEGDEIWVTDGTTAGSRRATSVRCVDPCRFINLGSEAAPEVAFAGENPAGGEDLYLTDGDGEERISYLMDAVPDSFSFPGGSPSVGRLGERVVFSAGETLDREPWVADGTRGGTFRLKNIAQLPPESNPAGFAPLGGATYFAVELEDGGELWRTGGTRETTRRAVDMPALGCESSAIDNVVALPAAVVFVCHSLFDPERIWATDGTQAGTVLIAPTSGFDTPRGLVSTGERVLFGLAGDEDPVWVTDGTPGGTMPLPGPGNLDHGAVFDGRIYFAGASEVWVSDGSPGGTTALAPYSRSDGDPAFVRLAGTVYYRTEEILRRIDPATEQVTDVTALRIDRMVAMEDHLLILGSRPGESGRVWRSDGTDAGTVPLEVAASFSALGLDGPELARAGAFAFFTAEHETLGIELWRSDGTSEGTEVLRNIWPDVGSSLPRDLTPAGDRLFFTAETRYQGRELWVTDGTEAGTRLVHDIAPGPFPSRVEELTVVGDRLYFSALDDLHGREPWALSLSTGTGCEPTARSLCLADDRFRVELEWVGPDELLAPGRAAPLTEDTGTFYFFNPDNREIVVKILDGRGLNDHFWVFYGALSNVEYSLTVTDSETGLTRRYRNPAGRFASRGDTSAFGPNGSSFSAYTAPAPVASEGSAAVRLATRGNVGGSCVASAARLCLLDGRFAVEASWRDFVDNTGVGSAESLTSDSGYFWFFNPANVEVMVKVVDGTSVNGRFWVFYGALSNVEYDLTVTDTVTGEVRVYSNPLQTFASVGDTAAF